MKTPDLYSREPRFIERDGVAMLQLTMAVNDYDHVRDLITGIIRPEGIILTPLTLQVEEIFFRFTHNLEWDVSEMSFAKYVSLTAAGNAPMLAIPVFPSRVFRHSAIYVRGDGGITTPQQLTGKTIGIPEWAQTAGVYVRGFLNDYYGVDLKSIRWVQAGVNQSGRVEKVKLNLPDGVRYESRKDTSLNEMLMSGQIDAAITARPPAAFHAGNTRIKRLFPDPRSEERKFFLDTGIFPIMHVVAIRRDVFNANRWTAMNLLKAFDEAKRRSVERLADVTASRIPLPWAAAMVEELAADFGTDMWPYGIEANLPTLEAFCRYAHEQGVAERRLEINELFPTEVQASVRV